MALFGDMSYNLTQTADMVEFMNSTIKMGGTRVPEFRVDKARPPRNLPVPFEDVTQVCTFDEELWACDKRGGQIVRVSEKGAEDVRRLLRSGDFRLANWAKFIDGVSSDGGSP